MSEEQLKAFLKAVKTDAGLQEKLSGAKADAVVAIAKIAGFMISIEDLQKAQAEVSEEELEGVAGGYCPIINGVVFTCALSHGITADPYRC